MDCSNGIFPSHDSHTLLFHAVGHSTRPHCAVTVHAVSPSLSVGVRRNIAWCAMECVSQYHRDNLCFESSIEFLELSSYSTLSISLSLHDFYFVSFSNRVWTLAMIQIPEIGSYFGHTLCIHCLSTIDVLCCDHTDAKRTNK